MAATSDGMAMMDQTGANLSATGQSNKGCSDGRKDRGDGDVEDDSGEVRKCDCCSQISSVSER